MAEFVEPGFVAPGFAGEAAVGSPSTVAGNSNRHWTDFREHRRGVFPSGDWFSLWRIASGSRIDGYHVELGDSNYFHMKGPDGRLGIVWGAPRLDTGLADQEEAFRFRILEQPTDRNLGLIRASGTAGLENGYYLKVGSAAGISIGKLVNGAATDLSSFLVSFRIGGFYVARFGAVGTTIRAKLWADGLPEPGWQIILTDTSLSSGDIGLMRNVATELAEIHYFAVGTNGESAPDEVNKEDGLDTYAQHPDEPLEITQRFEYYNPDTDSVEYKWLSNMGRVTGPTDYPANTAMDSLILDPGGITQQLEGDIQLSGPANVILDPIVLRNEPVTPNTPGPLSAWSRCSLYGRPVETRIGKRWLVKPSGASEGILNPHRRFEVVHCALPAFPPDVSLDRVTVRISPHNKNLSDKIPVRRNVGIPTGFKSLSNSGSLSIPSHVKYDIDKFVIYVRVYIPETGIPGASYSVLSNRFHTSNARLQWELIIFQASWVTASDRHKALFRAHATDGTVLFSSVLSPALNDGYVHHFIGGIHSAHLWYFNVDAGHVDGDAITKSVSIGNSVVTCAANATGCITFDHRIERFVSEDDALQRFSQRREPDLLNVSMHRCDDNTGSTVTDYNTTTANHGTLQGTDTVDRIWSPTYLGSSELAGVVMPFSGGAIFHAPAQNIDPTRNAFRYSDKVKTTGTDLNIRDRGLVVTGGGVSYSEPIEAKGAVDFVGAVSQPVTFGLPPATVETSDTHIPKLIRDELFNRESLAQETCDEKSFDALRRVLPLVGGFYYQEPPEVNRFLSEMLGSLGAFYTQDRDARIYTGIFTPTINPGPYGLSSLLEWVGLQHAGVTLPDTVDYRLTRIAGDFGLMGWFKTPLRMVPDLSVSTTGDYSQPGRTIVDKMNGGNTGYYVGIDGDTGAFRFAAGGIDFGGGLHYHKTGDYTYWTEDTWYMWSASVQDGFYFLEVHTWINEQSEIVMSAQVPGVTGTLADSAGIPLRIGHGPMGSFNGSVCHVYGMSAAQDPPSFSPFVLPQLLNHGGPNITIDENVMFALPLTDGKGNRALDIAQGNYGRIAGCRWCPKLILDYRAIGTSRSEGVRSLVPAYRIDYEYAANHQLLSHADIASSVSSGTRLALTTENASHSPSLQGIQADYKNSRNIPVRSPLYEESGPHAVVTTLLDRIGTNRRLIYATWDRGVTALNLADEVLIYDYQEGFETGKPVRIDSIAHRMTEGRLEGWG